MHTTNLIYVFVFSHTQYIGCTLIVSPTLPAEKAREVASSIIREGTRSNKRRVSLIFTPEEFIVNDTIYRVSLSITAPIMV